MKTLCNAILVAALMSGGALAAQERGEARRMRGTFVRLTEQQINEQGHLGIVIKPFESDEHVTVLVPRDNEDLRMAARQLKEGQTLAVAFAPEGPNNWVTRIESERPRDRAGESPEGRRIIVRREEIRRDEGNLPPRDEGQRRPAERDIRRDAGPGRESPEARRDRAVRSPEEQEHLAIRRQREGDRPAPGPEQLEAQIKEIITRNAEQMGRAFREILRAHTQRMQAEIRELRANAERMEREMQELRAQNERLRMQLRDRAEPGAERQRQMRDQPQPQRRRENPQAQEREPQREREPRREPAPSPQ